MSRVLEDVTPQGYKRGDRCETLSLHVLRHKVDLLLRLKPNKEYYVVSDHNMCCNAFPKECRNIDEGIVAKLVGREAALVPPNGPLS